MHTKEFKEMFNVVAKNNNFVKALGGWFKESAECIAVLDMQKSNYGNYYELNVKIFIQGAFNNTYVRSKNLVKTDVGDVFLRQPNAYRDVLDLDNLMTVENRKIKLEKLFNEFIVPITAEARTIAGIDKLAQDGKIFLLPAVKKEIDRLSQLNN